MKSNLTNLSTVYYNHGEERYRWKQTERTSS